MMRRLTSAADLPLGERARLVSDGRLRNHCGFDSSQGETYSQCDNANREVLHALVPDGDRRPSEGETSGPSKLK